MSKVFNIIRIVVDFIRYFVSAKYSMKNRDLPPSIADFNKNIIQAKTNSHYFLAIESVIKMLGNDERLLDYEEFGGGSQSFSTGQRKVCDIYKRMGVRKKYGRLLNRIVGYYQPSQVIELGTSIGISSSYMAFRNLNTMVHTIEANTALTNFARELTAKLKLPNVQFNSGLFSDVLPRLLQETTGMIIVFVDGNHTYDATMKHYYLLRRNVLEGLLIFDDIYWSKGMKKAWFEIKSAETLTIDLYQFGLVFKGEELIENHCKILY